MIYFCGCLKNKKTNEQKNKKTNAKLHKQNQTHEQFLFAGRLLVVREVGKLLQSNSSTHSEGKNPTWMGMVNVVVFGVAIGYIKFGLLVSKRILLIL